VEELAPLQNLYLTQLENAILALKPNLPLRKNLFSISIVTFFRFDHMRFINPTIEFAFKRIFGSSTSKDILISFLNALLYAGEAKIQDLEIIDPYSSGTIVGLKDSYLDVRARLDTQEIVII
jgi:hypothetical protein